MLSAPGVAQGTPQRGAAEVRLCVTRRQAGHVFNGEDADANDLKIEEAFIRHLTPYRKHLCIFINSIVIYILMYLYTRATIQRCLACLQLVVSPWHWLTGLFGDGLFG